MSDNDGEENHPVVNINPTRMRLRLRNVLDFELEGGERFVEENMDKYLSDLSNLAKAINVENRRSRRKSLPQPEQQPQLPLVFNENGTSSVLTEDDVPETNGISKSNNNGNHTSVLSDLIPFYLKTPRESQREQVLLIGYFFKKHLKYERVSLDDFRQAYAYLAEIPIDAPVNPTDVINRNISKNLMRKLDRGEFALTITGEYEVEKWLNGSDE